MNPFHCPARSVSWCACATQTIIHEEGCFSSYPTLHICTVGALAFHRPCQLGRHLLIELCSALHTRRIRVWEALTLPRTVYLRFDFDDNGMKAGVAFPMGRLVLRDIRSVQRQVRRWIAGNRVREEKRLALAMVLVPRLGERSGLAALTEDLLRMCCI